MRADYSWLAYGFRAQNRLSLFLFFDNKNPENKLKVNYLTFILIVGEKIVPQG